MTTGGRRRRIAAAGLLAALAAALPQVAGAQGIEDAAQAAAQGLGNNAVLIFLGLTLLSLAPGFAIMVTCFPFVVTVLSILRQSIGLQQSPPNMLIVSLAMFLTWFVMDPVLREAWDTAGAPLQQGVITVHEAFERGIRPFRDFMAARTDPDTLAALAEVAPGRPGSGPQDGTGLPTPPTQGAQATA